ncbi:MAG: ABC transporter permease, partial [Enhygromyxa sp.]
MRINTRPFTVVGVMPAGFGGADAQPSVDAWVTTAMLEGTAGYISWDDRASRGSAWLDGIARLAPGVTQAQAQAEVNAVTAAVIEAEGLEAEDMRLGLVPANVAAVDAYGFEGAHRNAWLLLGVTGALLLLAMANTAGLLLVRAEERGREIALRLGLGASRGAVLRMLLVEALLYAFVGAACGVALAFAILSVALEPLAGMLSGAPTDPSLLLSWRALVFAMALSVVTAVLSAMSPAARVIRLDVNTSLKQGGSRGDRAGSRARSALVVAQVVISVGLLTVALLLVRSFWNTAVVDPGFDPQRTLVVGMDFTRQGYSPAEALRAQDAILARLDASPLVEAAAFAVVVPVQGAGIFSSFSRPGMEQHPQMRANVDMVSPGYFATLQIPVLRGRALAATDIADTTRVAVINQHLAERWFPGEDALGQSLDMLSGELRIVEITANTKVRDLREDDAPIVYVPLAQRPDGNSSLVVRGAVDDPWLLLPAVREAVQSVDRAVPLFRVRTLVDHVGRSYREATVMAWLLGAFAVVAVLLSAAGLFGLLSWQ